VYRIDNVTTVPQLPIVGPSVAPGFFTDGNPAAGLEATVVDAWWLNMLQEEVLFVVTAAGIAPDKASHRQLYDAIRAIAIGENPDLSAYLPLSGGTLAGPGNLTVAGQLTVSSGRMRATGGNWPSLTLHNLADNRAYAIGCGSGRLRLGLETGDSVPSNGLEISDTGLVDCMQSLNVRGSGTVAGNLNVGGDLVLTGSGYLARPSGSDSLAITAAGAGNLANITLGANFVHVPGSLGATGSGSFNGDLSVGGHSWLGNVNGWDLHLGGGLNVSAATSLHGGLNVAGETHLAATGIHGQFYADYDVSVAGGLTVAGHVQMNNNAALAGQLDVGGTIYCGNVQCNTFDLVLAQPGIGQISRPGGGDIHIQPTGGGYSLNEVRLNSNNLWLQGNDAWKGQGIEWIPWSDIRLKKDIEPYKRGLEAVRQFEPVSYATNGLGGYPDDGRRYVGLIAQDCRDIMPEMVRERGLKLHADDTAETPLLALDGTALKYAMLNAIKELAERLDTLERRT
jgi:hypothetical protein